MPEGKSSGEFRASTWRLADVYGFTFLFFGVEVWTVAGGVINGFIPMIFACLALFGFMLISCLWFALVPATVIRIAADAVTFQSPLKQKRVLDSDVEYISAGRTGNNSFLTIKLLDGSKAITRIGSFLERDQIVAILNERYRNAESNAIQAALARCHRFPVNIWAQFFVIVGAICLFAGSVMASAPDKTDQTTTVLVLAAGVLLIVAPLLVPKPYIQVNPDEVTRKTPGGMKSIRWDQVTLVTLYNIQSKGGANEFAWIQSGDVKITASDSIVDDFAFLRDIILAQVPASKVEDKRGS